MELKISVGTPGAVLIDEIDAGRPVIALIHRGKLALSFGNFSGSHFVTVIGYTTDGFVIHDPLGTAGGSGDSLRIAPQDFINAWETTPGNSGRYQALLIDPASMTVPPPPPPQEPKPVDELQQRVWAALDAWIDAENQAREANQRASELGFTFRSLYAEYLSLRQETIEEAERKAA